MQRCAILYDPQSQPYSTSQRTRDDSDKSRLTRRIASRVSRDYKPIMERAKFVERVMLFRDLGGTVHDNIEVAAAQANACEMRIYQPVTILVPRD